jgi:hypothetical protein
VLDDTVTQEETRPAALRAAAPIFETDHLRADLKGRFVRGSAVTVLGQGAVLFTRGINRRLGPVTHAARLRPSGHGDGRDRVRHAIQKAGLVDGGRALWEKAQELIETVGGPVFCVLDVFHVLEYLWLAAYCFHPEGSREAQALVTDRLRRLLHGHVGYVIGGLRQMRTKRRLGTSQRDHLSKVIGYLSNNRAYMRYDVCLSQGYPIGSGVVEGACRHVVKDRMEGTGMRWCIAGAQAMLDLRGIYCNGDWETFQQYRITTETRRLYPYRWQMHRLYRKTA